MKKLLLLIFLLVPIHAFAQDCTKGQTVTFAQLPTVKYQGTACTVTDTTGCTIGSPVTAGGGSTTCQVAWFTPNWIAQSSTAGGSGGGTNLAAPGPIGGTTPSTGQFTALGINGAAPAIGGGIGFSNTGGINCSGVGSAGPEIGNENANLCISSGNAGSNIVFSNNTSILGKFASSGGAFTATYGVGIGTDNIANTMARMPLRFDEGREAALAPNESMGTFQVVKAMTIENIILDIKVSPTCTVSEQIVCYDCGASAGACTAGQTSTVMSAVTVATGATRTSISEPINTANVAAGEYVSCLITAGTCTVSDNSIQMMARPQ